MTSSVHPTNTPSTDATTNDDTTQNNTTLRVLLVRTLFKLLQPWYGMYAHHLTYGALHARALCLAFISFVVLASNYSQCRLLNYKETHSKTITQVDARSTIPQTSWQYSRSLERWGERCQGTHQRTPASRAYRQGRSSCHPLLS